MYAQMPRSKWIEKCLGMVTLSGSAIWWTWETEDVFRRVRDGNKYAMKVTKPILLCCMLQSVPLPHLSLRFCPQCCVKVALNWRYLRCLHTHKLGDFQVACSL